MTASSMTYVLHNHLNDTHVTRDDESTPGIVACHWCAVGALFSYDTGHSSASTGDRSGPKVQTKTYIFPYFY